MRVLMPAMLVGACLLCSSCLVLSLSPLYTEDDIVFEPALLGSWVLAGEDGEDDYTYNITQLGDNGYYIENYDPLFDYESSYTVGYLVRIGDQLMLDVFPDLELNYNTTYPADVLYSHVFYRIDQLEPTLIITCLEPEWLKGYLRDYPYAVSHLRGSTPLSEPIWYGEAEYSPLLLTAEPFELQSFVDSLMDEPLAWYEPEEYVKVWGVE